jgi:hypothetical protein
VPGLDPSLFLSGAPVLFDRAGRPADRTVADPALLVRPDGYAAWAAGAAAGPDTLTADPCWSLLGARESAVPAGVSGPARPSGPR